MTIRYYLRHRTSIIINLVQSSNIHNPNLCSFEVQIKHVQDGTILYHDSIL
jgi:hypothetical protein